MTERSVAAGGREPARRRIAQRVRATALPAVVFTTAAVLLLSAGYVAGLASAPAEMLASNPGPAPGSALSGGAPLDVRPPQTASPAPPDTTTAPLDALAAPAEAATPAREPAGNEAGPVEAARLRAEAADRGAPPPGPITAPLSPPAEITIPALGLAQQLVPLEVQESELQTPEGYGDIGWWRGGPKPGSSGAAVVVGHVDSPQGPAVFYQLAGLSPGAEISVLREDGSTAVFAVDRVERYSREDFPSDLVYRRDGQAGLNLLTCGGRYDAAVGQYEDNVVVFTTLVADTALDA
jgi:hypothetical protein